jgi:hypothetical protein
MGLAPQFSPLALARQNPSRLTSSPPQPLLWPPGSTARAQHHSLPRSLMVWDPDVGFIYFSKTAARCNRPPRESLVIPAMRARPASPHTRRRSLLVTPACGPYSSGPSPPTKLR